MVYVIDSEGVIRAKDVRGKAIDAAVDPLVGQLGSRPRRDRRPGIVSRKDTPLTTSSTV